MYNNIQYFLITERDPVNGNMLFPPMCGTSLPIMPFLGRYPHNIEHYALGVDYYLMIMRHQIQSGYSFNVVYTDNFEKQISSLYSYKGVLLFFLTVFSQQEAAKLKDILLRNHIKNIYYQPINMPPDEFISMPNFIDSHYTFLNWLHEKVNDYIPFELLKDRDPFCVPISAKEIERKRYFTPTLNNLFTTECIWGNWQGTLADDNMPIEERTKIIKKETQTAKANPDKFHRQQIFVRQIEEVDFALKISYHSDSIQHPGLGVQLFSSLILVSPFNSPIIKEIYEIKSKDRQQQKTMKKVIQRLLEVEQGENYLHSITVDNLEEEVKALVPRAESYFKRRMCFLDNAGYLHSSIKFSPYVRLPLVGKSIYGLLSTVGVSTGRQLIQAGKVKKIHKKIKEIGDILTEKLISPELREVINPHYS